MSVRDKPYPEGSRHHYWDPNPGGTRYCDESAGLSVDITHHEMDAPVPSPSLVMDRSREDMLQEEMMRRFHASESTEFPLLQKVKQFFLQLDWKNLLKPNFSTQPVYNYSPTIVLPEKASTELGLDSHDPHQLTTDVSWCFNSTLNGRLFTDESGKRSVVHHAITSSNDRTAPNICMMRRVDDHDTGASIAYTGRPDTKARAKEQIAFIVRNERNKEKSKLIWNGDGTYTLTYVVNNLMSPMSGIGLIAHDDQAATYREHAVLQALAGQTVEVDGIQVKVEPIYFSQPFNITTALEGVIDDRFSGRGAAREMNAPAYERLFAIAEKKMKDHPEKELLNAVVNLLKNERHDLLPEEELFFRSALIQLLNLANVTHCKSSADRTTLALALTKMAFQLRALGKLNKNSLREILKTETAKELFAGHCLGDHIVTRPARTCPGMVKGHEIGTRHLGFEWSTNPIAGRMLPERYTKQKTPSFGVTAFWNSLFAINVLLSPLIWAVSAITTQNIFFNPLLIRPGNPLPERLIDVHSPYVGQGEGRSLIQPKDLVNL